MSYKLLVTIVPHNSGEFITTTANNAGAGGGTIIMGRGTAANGILQLLGLGDTSKDITLNLVTEEKAKFIQDAIISAADEKKEHFGVFFSINVDDFIKAGNISETNTNSENKGDGFMANSYEMINIIVNKGYAEDAMAAARKAGAGGGTIVSARGTAKEGDAQFFGMNIVPEKDMLIILVPSEKKDAIIQAVKHLPCFAEAGSGIIFCNEAKDFTLLGNSK